MKNIVIEPNTVENIVLRIRYFVNNLKAKGAHQSQIVVYLPNFIKDAIDVYSRRQAVIHTPEIQIENLFSRAFVTPGYEQDKIIVSNCGGDTWYDAVISFTINLAEFDILTY